VASSLATNVGIDGSRCRYSNAACPRSWPNQPQAWQSLAFNALTCQHPPALRNVSGACGDAIYGDTNLISRGRPPLSDQLHGTAQDSDMPTPARLISRPAPYVRIQS
jgi:hypothetical protein